MTINRVLIDPGHGHDGSGVFDEGVCVKGVCTSEVQCIDVMVRKLKEELADRYVRCEVLPTRTQPGLSAEQRANVCARHDLMLSIHMGASAKPTAWNEAVVRVNAESPLTAILVEECHRWGRVTSEAWKGARMVKMNRGHPLFEAKGLGIEICPFDLNGADPIIFAARLETLAVRLAVELAAWLAEKNPHFAPRALTARYRTAN